MCREIDVLVALRGRDRRREGRLRESREIARWTRRIEERRRLAGDP